jgi:hypothetical protein
VKLNYDYKSQQNFINRTEVSNQAGSANVSYSSIDCPSSRDGLDLPSLSLSTLVTYTTHHACRSLVSPILLILAIIGGNGSLSS